jgi:hypothetical protein
MSRPFPEVHNSGIVTIQLFMRILFFPSFPPKTLRITHNSIRPTIYVVPAVFLTIVGNSQPKIMGMMVWTRPTLNGIAVCQNEIVHFI